MQPQVTLGRTVITAAAHAELDEDDVLHAMARHMSGDWGDVCPEDREANEMAVREGRRLVSVYKDRKGTTFWVITEADRSATTVLMPEDY
jgi:hypothetical protein